MSLGVEQRVQDFVMMGELGTRINEREMSKSREWFRGINDDIVGFVF